MTVMINASVMVTVTALGLGPEAAQIICSSRQESYCTVSIQYLGTLMLQKSHIILIQLLAKYYSVESTKLRSRSVV
jgi:hypothetical protein